MRPKVMSEIEASILAHIASETSDPALRAQLSRVRVIEREYTGCGCFTLLEPLVDAPETKEAYGQRGPLEGPIFESPSVEYGGGSLLWFKDGRAHKLEIYANGDSFPEDHKNIVELKIIRWVR